MSQVLELQFQTEGGKTATITVDHPKAHLTPADIQQVMQTIVEQNVFDSPSGTFTAVKGARIIDRQVSTFTLVTP
ncbi:DUF2922 domain-containing protein [Lysinibacillus piscis]|uniref:DUF2922 domain-containing protein n=1 Tax=Lysinibacillus piscis TaxID=2518931 RepID=A0ABQ5NLR7_9BACI|nr:DUF2922 domain-containing protein [Lysinibacillus sp. KH24]GLC89308.1 hypothetical protein LYSBPC_24350 [Lysinibacillus sp. KH24]